MSSKYKNMITENMCYEVDMQLTFITKIIHVKN